LKESWSKNFNFGPIVLIKAVDLKFKVLLLLFFQEKNGLPGFLIHFLERKLVKELQFWANRFNQSC